MKAFLSSIIRAPNKDKDKDKDKGKASASSSSGPSANPPINQANASPAASNADAAYSKSYSSSSSSSSSSLASSSTTSSDPVSNDPLGPLPRTNVVTPPIHQQTNQTLATLCSLLSTIFDHSAPLKRETEYFLEEMEPSWVSRDLTQEAQHSQQKARLINTELPVIRERATVSLQEINADLEATLKLSNDFLASAHVKDQQRADLSIPSLTRLHTIQQACQQQLVDAKRTHHETYVKEWAEMCAKYHRTIEGTRIIPAENISTTFNTATAANAAVLSVRKASGDAAAATAVQAATKTDSTKDDTSIGSTADASTVSSSSTSSPSIQAATAPTPPSPSLTVANSSPDDSANDATKSSDESQPKDGSSSQSSAQSQQNKKGGNKKSGKR